MPLTLPATRRHFLTGAAATAVAAFTRAEEAAASELWYMLSDTHIAADPATIARDVNVAAHLEQAVKSVLAGQQQEKAFGLFINGDLALDNGQPGDYATFVKLLQPLRDSGLDVHLTLGNHDDREKFKEACSESLQLKKSALDHHHTGIITSAVVNWVLLDSLEATDSTPGLLGESQLGWLDRTLRDLPNKPTLIMVHHNPQGPVAEGKKATGIKDTEAMMRVLEAHSKVKAFIYGHTHNWEVKTKNSGVHFINLPPVAYAFNKERPSGYVEARVTSTSLELKLISLDEKHPLHGEKKVLRWDASA